MGFFLSLLSHTKEKSLLTHINCQPTHRHGRVQTHAHSTSRRRVHRIHSRRQMADTVDAFRQSRIDNSSSTVLFRFAQHHFVYILRNGTLCICAPWIIVLETRKQCTTRFDLVFRFRYARGGIDVRSRALVETAPPSWASDRRHKKSWHRKHVWADRRHGCERRVRVRNSKAVMSSPLGFRISHRPMSKSCTYRERRASGASACRQCSRW